MIDIKFFARLRDQLGTDQLQIEAANIKTVADIQRTLGCAHPDWQAPLAASHVLVAVNQTMAQTETRVKDGDEVAFFPPVTGG